MSDILASTETAPAADEPITPPPVPIAETAASIAETTKLTEAERDATRAEATASKRSLSETQRDAQNAKLAAKLRPAGYDALVAARVEAAGKVAALEAQQAEAERVAGEYQRLVNVAAGLDERLTLAKREIETEQGTIASSRAILIETSGAWSGYGSTHPPTLAREIAAAVSAVVELETAASALAKQAEDALTAAVEYATANGISAP